tara:strand:- start:34028 stop:36457 length:2430 start_codon:yes stop_codon:yes gene_type:complete
MDPTLWKQLNHNPVKLLHMLSQTQLKDLSEDQAFLAKLQSVQTQFQTYIESTEKVRAANTTLTSPVAYFSAEFGLHESLPVYSGGLGILAGDHCKSASDLALPLVGVGLLYKSGYFVQSLTPEGVQEAHYPDNNFDDLPINPILRDGKELRIQLTIAGEEVLVKCWEVNVGRIKLYLMDTDIPENSPQARVVTSRLYGGGTETRIAQEMLLGIGGVRMLKALDINPSVFHINEGHAAFLGLERIADVIREQGLQFEEACELLATEQVFTTHTPVPAGHDRFDRNLVERFVGPILAEMGLAFEKVWQLGKEVQEDGRHLFCMTILALNTSKGSNGVSMLHGKVSRDMWKKQWPSVPVDEVPIGHITNGVHSMTWLGHEIGALYEKHLGKDWEEHKLDRDFWDGVDAFDDKELWDAHSAQKQRLVDLIRERTFAQRDRFQEPAAQRDQARKMLDPQALTIGFARRFAPYKRASLVFKDPERLRRILNAPGRPVQIVFAGKSHPHNQEGKDLIKEVYQFSREEGFEGKVVFIEDYDANIGRHLVQGVDVWLNNPIRPQEASGTSGQKVPLNGGLNFSILDGWWVEGYEGDNGWAIGDGMEYGQRDNQDYMDAHSLYDILEQQIIPAYYHRDAEGLPDTWLQYMRRSMKSVNPAFNTRRMVLDYTRQMYEPAETKGALLRKDAFGLAKDLHAWKQAMQQQWSQIEILQTSSFPKNRLAVGETYTIEADVKLGSISPSDVRVELYVGRFDEHNACELSQALAMTLKGDKGPGTHHFEVVFTPEDSGDYGYNIRILPTHPHLMHPHETGLLTWGE